MGSFTRIKFDDSHINESVSSDLLIGANVFGHILLEGTKKGSTNEPITETTIFGWILSRPVANKTRTNSMSYQGIRVVSHDELHKDMRKFWELEKILYTRILSPEEFECELHFQQNYVRRKDGKYQVKPPFKENPFQILGNTEIIAKKIFMSDERRLVKDNQLFQDYQSFLTEYLDLTHMKAVHISTQSSDLYFLSHLPVIRESSQTTKLRVVFNASMGSTNGLSLNDCLHIGPKLKTDLISLLMKWRKHRFVYTIDISKMFRQILVSSSDANHQCILWKKDPNSQLKIYR